jgi:Mg/Co/Ni transporter MgtE
MIRESAFRQKGVYANRVRISSQNGKIYELSSHKNELAVRCWKKEENKLIIEHSNFYLKKYIIENLQTNTCRRILSYGMANCD